MLYLSGIYHCDHKPRVSVSVSCYADPDPNRHLRQSAFERTVMFYFKVKVRRLSHKCVFGASYVVFGTFVLLPPIRCIRRAKCCAGHGG